MELKYVHANMYTYIAHTFTYIYHASIHKLTLNGKSFGNKWFLAEARECMSGDSDSGV